MNIFSSRKEKGEDSASIDSTSTEIHHGSFNRNDVLICATHGNIYAIHKRDGGRLWRTGFPGGSLGGSIVSLFVTDTDKLIAASRGRTTCLDLMTGKEIWVNKMPGFGVEEVSIITTPSRFLKPSKLPIHNNEDLPPHYSETHTEKPVVISGTRGKIMSFDLETGQTLWTFDCPGGRYKIPVTIVEPPSLEDGRPEQLVYIGCGKWVYCLRALTGKVVWSSKVSKANIGLNYMTLATPWSSRLAAEAYSAFSQHPSAQARDQEREKERSNGGGG